MHFKYLVGSGLAVTLSGYDEEIAPRPSPKRVKTLLWNGFNLNIIQPVTKDSIVSLSYYILTVYGISVRCYYNSFSLYKSYCYISLAILIKPGFLFFFFHTM